MERIGSLVIPDYGLKTNDVKHLSMESVVRGRGADRLKYLDLDGRWILSGSSIPYISAAFNHLERLNDASLPMRDIKDEPLDAIGMVSWTKSSVDAEPKPAEKRSESLPRRTPLREQKPVEPRESVPYRSAGYGDAHERRRLSISSDRSRSASPQKGLHLSPEDHGYTSASPSPRDNELTDAWRPSSRTRRYDTDFEYGLIRKSGPNGHYIDELKVSTAGATGGYSDKLQYNISPRSLGSAGNSPYGSEQGSPNLRSVYRREVIRY